MSSRISAHASSPCDDCASIPPQQVRAQSHALHVAGLSHCSVQLRTKVRAVRRVPLDHGGMVESHLRAMARILVVEDEKDLQEVLSYNLRQAGHEATIVGTGQEGLERIGVQTPDLVLLDLMLPDMSGTDVCRALKSDPATRNIPVVMLTAKGEEIDRVVGFELGA